MSEVKFTKEQKSVIDARKCNLLVSAAAGSGKTAVLVARIIGRLLDEEEPVSLDRLLVMTFTRAAAEGMRGKLSEALSGKIRETEELLKTLPEGSEAYGKAEERIASLKSQEAILPRARIATIDSVCQNLIRQYFQYLEIDPAFRVADEAELKLMRSDLLKDLLEEAYAEGSEDFLRFSEAFTRNGLDERISDLILRTYEFAEANPWPEEFIRACRQDAVLEKQGDVFASEWFKNFTESMRKEAERLRRLAETTVKDLKKEGGWTPYLETAEPVLSFCESFCRCLSQPDPKKAYLDARALLAEFSAPQLSRRKCDGGDAAAKKKAKDAIDSLRKQVKGLAAGSFLMDEGELVTATEKSAGDLIVLCDLTEKFMERFGERKRRKSVVDFGDLEHLALKLLYMGEGEKRTFSPLADELARGLDEILIDEYQDSNDVQEQLIRALSAERFGRPDVFMVGDVKQSIYSFRQAKPELFLEKYRVYGADGKNVKIELSTNFRSRPEVLSSVNDVFREIMKEEVGGISYDEKVALHPGRTDCLDGDGAPVPCPDAVTELLLAEESEAMEPDGESEIYFDPDECEAVMIAERILELTDPVKNEKPWRKKDITVLLRSTGKAETLVDVLDAFGIDACYDSAAGYFASKEVSTVLAFLSVIDNPRQDLALVTVLKSPIGAFSDEELSLIRGLADRKEDRGETDFYEALRESESAKAAAFLEKLENYRNLAGHLPVHELIHRIYEDTGYYGYASALPGGRRRRRNLDMLLEKAENYAATSYHGLFNFTRYIEQLKNYETDYGEASSLLGDGDVVHITTVHKSKGLEYPVVILAGMHTRFNTSDTAESVMLHEKLGMACDYVDTEKRIRYPSLKANLIRERMKEEQAGEELRVLYVAMTRAREKLILTGRVNDFYEKEEELAGKTQDLMHAGSELKFLLQSGITKKKSIRVHIYENAALMRTCPVRQEEKKSIAEILSEKTVPESELEPVRRKLTASYAHEAEAGLKPKVSVSELKAKMISDTEFEFVRDLEENRKTKGAEYGTIVHRAFELYDYAKETVPEIPGVEAEIMDSVRKVLSAFGKTPLHDRMKKAALEGSLYREQHFMAGFPASVLTPESDSEELQLLQGIIDAYLVTPGGITLIDYKTDRVEEEETLVSRYALQLDLYAKALEQLTRIPVTEKLIYSTHFAKEIRL